MGQDICIRKDEKPLGYDWECGHEELYVRVNMYYNGSLYVGLWQKQKECEKKLELFGDLTIGVMGFLRPGQAIISDCGAKAKVAFIEKYKLGKVVGKRKINYGSYYVAEFNLARLAQLDPGGTERYLLENGLDQKEFKASNITIPNTNKAVYIILSFKSSQTNLRISRKAKRRTNRS